MASRSQDADSRDTWTPRHTQDADDVGASRQLNSYSEPHDEDNTGRTGIVF